MITSIEQMSFPGSLGRTNTKKRPEDNPIVPQPHAATKPICQQGYVQKQPVSGQFVQQAQVPIQPMTQQVSIQQQPVSTSAPMFPPQQQNPPPPAPPK